MMWLVLVLLPFAISFSGLRDRRFLSIDGEDCDGDSCSLFDFESVFYENPVDSLFINQNSKLRFFRKWPLWASGSNNNSNSPLDELIENTRNNKSVLLIDFYANWCGPCRAMDKNLVYNKFIQAEVSAHYRDMNILTIKKINVDDEYQYNDRFNVTALPTLVFIAKGQVIHNIKGVIPPDKAIELIDKIIETL